VWCIYICINSTDHPSAHSALPEVVSVGACVYLFQFPLPQRLHVYPRNISKKKLQKRIFGSPSPECTYGLVMICILVHAETEKVTKFSFSQKPMKKSEFDTIGRKMRGIEMIHNT